MASTGIGGIERKIKQKQVETDKNISEAFQDLNMLMVKASDMAKLAQGMVERLKEKGDIGISNDETVLFKSYLLKLGMCQGLEDLVTKEKYANESQYHRDLGKEIAIIIKEIMVKNDGIMTLPDIFCAVNRARGLNLISAEDLLNACYTLKPQSLGYKLVKYDSGLMVLEADDFDEETMSKHTFDIVISGYGPLQVGTTAQELALKLSISLSLARQRLLLAEKNGLLCRDESIQGLSFFPNKFLQKTD